MCTSEHHPGSGQRKVVGKEHDYMSTDLRMKRVGSLALMLAVGMMATACGKDTPNPATPTPTPTPATVSSVVVTSASTTGVSFQLTATARMSDNTSRDVTSLATWTTSNAALGTVSSTGFVTVVGNGGVDLGATYQGVAGSVHVSVSLPPAFTLSGAVMAGAPTGGPIVGARVQLLTIDDNHTFSDANGIFALSIAPGRMILEVTKAGYQTYSNEIVIDRDTQLTVTLSLTPVATNGLGATVR
jgi:hypothetical protein